MQLILYCWSRDRDDQEVAVVYFRSGYAPDQYPTENVSCVLQSTSIRETRFITIQFITIQFITIQLITVHFNTIQLITIQYPTENVSYSTVNKYPWDSGYCS